MVLKLCSHDSLSDSMATKRVLRVSRVAPAHAAAGYSPLEGQRKKQRGEASRAYGLCRCVVGGVKGLGDWIKLPLDSLDLSHGPA